MRRVLLGIALWFALALQAQAVITVTTIGTNFNSAGATLAITGITVPAGSTIIVATYERTNTASGGSLSDGTAYTSIVHANPNGSSTQGLAQVFYLYSVAGLSGGTLTYTKQGSGAVTSMTAFYASGTTTTPLDTAVTASATGNSAAPSVTGGAPTVVNELIVGFVAANGSTTDTFTQDSTNGAYAAPPDSAYALVTGAQLAGGSIIYTGLLARKYAPTITSKSWADFIVGFMPATAAATRFRTLLGVGQ